MLVTAVCRDSAPLRKFIADWHLDVPARRSKLGGTTTAAVRLLYFRFGKDRAGLADFGFSSVRLG